MYIKFVAPWQYGHNFFGLHPQTHIIWN